MYVAFEELEAESGLCLHVFDHSFSCSSFIPMFAFVGFDRTCFATKFYQVVSSKLLSVHGVFYLLASFLAH